MVNGGANVEWNVDLINTCLFILVAVAVISMGERKDRVMRYAFLRQQGRSFFFFFFFFREEIFPSKESPGPKTEGVCGKVSLRTTP